MTKDDIKKALECCREFSKEKCESCPYYFIGHGCLRELFTNSIELINLYEAEIESLKSDLTVARQLSKDREQMPIPYDEDEFLRKAILQVLGWIEELPSFRIFGTATVTKTRVDELKANIKKRDDADINRKRFEGVVSTDDVDNFLKKISEVNNED
jgi:hypothetical protein